MASRPRPLSPALRWLERAADRRIAVWDEAGQHAYDVLVARSVAASEELRRDRASLDGARVALAWFTAPNDSARVNVAFSNDAGATFGTPTRIDAGSPAGRVDLALLADGGALVTWVERTGGDGAAVRVRRVARDGKAGMPVTIAASSAARANGFPKVAITGSNVMFAWTVAGKPSMVRVARAALTEFK